MHFLRATLPRLWWLPWALTLALVSLALPLASRAQAEALYFLPTGHTLGDEHGFLSYWRTHNGERLLGLPLTEAFEAQDLTVQYFERGRLELHPELVGAPLLLGLVGTEYLAQLGKRFPDADRDALAPETPFFELTGQSLAEPFLSFWQHNGGLMQFGYPLSEPVWEFTEGGQLLVQYFERARLEHHPRHAGTPYEVQVGLLGRDLAALYGLNTAASNNLSGAPVYGSPQFSPPTSADLLAMAIPAEQIRVESLPAPERIPPALAAPAPAPVEVLAAEPVYVEPEPAYVEPAPAPATVSYGGGKSIVVSVGDQWLYAYEGGALIYSAPVTTGKDGFNTPIGNFSVYAKIPSQTMSGNLGGEYYSVPNVPSVMYINGGVALHGTYWHNLFGSGARVSHGCINLSIGDAAWLYNWAPMGTPVSVTW
jgi:lipoprotein-anchoring transpeptidase ErfK/SrfK